VLGDEARLRQVVSNLLSNAIKFTSAGVVVVRLTVESRTAEQVGLRVEVDDSGVGIPPEARQRIFDPFVQAESSTNRRFGGTGLGLAIAHRLVELMGGAIGVRTSLGRGSTFWFTVTLSVPSDAAEALRPNDLQGLGLLIVDGPAPARAAFREVALSWGMRCETASGAHEGTMMLEGAARAGTPYTLVMLDAEAGGLALARATRANPVLPGTRIVMLCRGGMPSASADPGVVHAWLGKPASHAQLYGALLTAMTPDAARLPGGLLDSGDGHPAWSGEILVVDDNDLNQELAVAMLKNLGCRAARAAGGKEAIEAVLRKRYDLVLMDCQMPGIDGFDATRTIRENEARSKDSTRQIIVALTAHAMREDRERCLAAGMDDYLAKPLTFEALTAVLERWLPVPDR
jgi:CheY-like chemotaxis protein